MSEIGFWNFANNQPEKLALVDPKQKEWSRGELHGLANTIVHSLRSLGLKRGDSIAVVLPNCAEYFALNLACAQSGLYMVPVNWHLAGPEIAYILSDSGADVFFGSSENENISKACLSAAKEANFTSENSISIGSLEGFTEFTSFLSGQSSEIPKERSPGSVMNYTSGTTGKPKGVKRNLAEGDPDEISSLFAMFLGLFGIEKEDSNVHICASPLYHTAPLLWSSSSLHLGHPVVLMNKFEAEEMLKLIEKYKITTSHMVPTQFHRLLSLPEKIRSKYDCSSTKRMIHAAAPCPPHIKEAMINWWGNSIYEYYAATEGGGTMVSPEEWLKYPGTVGKPWLGSDIKIINENSEEVSSGEEGMVYMLLGQAQFEYKGDKEKTEESRWNDYFTVGDIGYVNEEGYLFLCDRKTDMIISGGANIYPAEIENVFLMHKKVADVAVFGIPNEEWGEEIKAIIQPAEGINGDEKLTKELMDFCSNHLGKMKHPKSINYLETMPRDPNGKLYKRRLKEPYWEGKERKI
ncbi:uncharacterized protein METZ01_LOCUS95767 [marine metagenome]|uniref:AMP-dependent synthetase/ligase domain-containing protein n=1 Tax=marine metagenome TaxID=408172 RepID=A0A381VTM3_9ZZZZ|tara:strand:- start:400 stop:1959 length:1560 start_codon:yes stop_codon:yes gene_type:complete